jgi:nitrous oxidase accessory protein NosD
MIYNNDIAGSQIGIKLANQTETHVGKGNEVYDNNVFDNEENVVVETGQTDNVSWDNGVVGNYWSDYDGQGTYVIDEDNVDYHPLTQQVDISTAAPEPPSETPLLTIAVVAMVSAIVIGVGLLVYLKRRRRDA